MYVALRAGGTMYVATGRDNVCSNWRDMYVATGGTMYVATGGTMYVATAVRVRRSY